MVVLRRAGGTAPADHVGRSPVSVQRRHLFYIKTIFVPAHRIRLDIFPNPLVLLPASDHMVMEGGLPYLHIRTLPMDRPCDIGLEGTNHNRGICSAGLHHQDHMDMIRHHNKAVHPRIWENLWDLEQRVPSKLAKMIQLSLCPENIPFLMGANGYEVVIGS